jgi:trypsin
MAATRLEVCVPDAAGPAAGHRPRTLAAASAVLALAFVLLAGSATAASRPSPKATTSIAGGYYPDPNAWPWVTALVDPTQAATNGDYGGGHQVCTAVLIAPQRVLTAAHCVDNADNVTPRPANRFQALVGRRDLTITTQGERRNVTGVAMHPKAHLPDTGVHTNHAFYDIAVLFLDAPVTTIPPAVIGAPTDWNTWATAMGFGHFNYDHDNPRYDQHLRAADYDLLNDGQCASWFDEPGTQHFFGTIHVCANNGPNVPNVDCITHGDSGGPLMIRKADNSWRLIGITSFYPASARSDRCNGAGGPFGFAWVAGAEMRDWPLTVPHPPVTPSGGGGGAEVDLSMARSDLRGYVRYLIRQNTNGKVRGLSKRCARTTYRSFNCRLQWRIRRHRYSGNASIWTFAENNEAYWTYVFKGKRRTIGGGRVKRLKW